MNGVWWKNRLVQMLNTVRGLRLKQWLRVASWSLETREKCLGLLMFSPVLLLFFCFFAYPLVFGVVLSFYRLNTITLDGPFIGVENYHALLRGDDLRNALQNTLYWSVGGVLLQTLLGLAVALLLNEQFPGRNLARGLVLSPYLIPTVVAVAIWRWMFSAQFGIINYAFLRMGFTVGPVEWLSSTTLAMPTAILLSTWKNFPFVVVALLPRLQTIPEALYAAAKVDGASAWHRFTDITLPQLRSVLVVVILMRFIFDFNDFAMLQLLTGGGPLHVTETLPLLVYRQMFGRFNAGAAASVAVIMLVVLVVMILLYLRLVRTESEAETT